MHHSAFENNDHHLKAHPKTTFKLLSWVPHWILMLLLLIVVVVVVVSPLLLL